MEQIIIIMKFIIIILILITIILLIRQYNQECKKLDQLNKELEEDLKKFLERMKNR